jgi:inosine/xanthosine triphosphate pyrophosphatase family protein
MTSLLNGFGFDKKFLNAAKAKEDIAEMHESWKKLRSGKAEAGKLWTRKA